MTFSMFAQMPSISIFNLHPSPFALRRYRKKLRVFYPPFPRHLELELGSPPVTPLGVVSDRVSGPHSDPLRNRPILLLLLSQHFLNLQRLVRRHLLIF